MCLRKFLGLQTACKHAYTDGSAELEGACEKLDILHDASTPYRPETNGIIERANRRIKEGSSCALVQSGLAEEWWPQAVLYFCFMRCIYDKLVGGQTAWRKRFGTNFHGPYIPFGAEIHYKPIKEEDLRRCHKFGSKMLPGIFIGYSQHAGGGWNGDLLVLDWEQMAKAERVCDVQIKRFKAAEVDVIVFPDGSFRFPLAEGALSQPGNNRAIKRKTRAQIHQEHAERMRELDESSSVHVEPGTSYGGAHGSQDDSAQSTPIGGAQGPLSDSAPNIPTGGARGSLVPDYVSEGENEDYWTLNKSVLIRHHVIPRTKLFTLKEALPPIPRRYIDVVRYTTTDLDAGCESFIQDVWVEEGDRELSDSWVGTTSFDLIQLQPPRGYHWAQGRLTKNDKRSKRPKPIYPEAWKGMSEADRKEAIEFHNIFQPKVDAARKKIGIKQHVDPAEAEEYKFVLKHARDMLQAPAAEAPAMPLLFQTTGEGQPLTPPDGGRGQPLQASEESELALTSEEAIEAHKAVLYQMNTS